MQNVEKQGSGWWIPSGIVNPVVAGVILMSLGTSGSAVWMSFKLFAAIEKIESIPSLELRQERRQNYLDFRDDSRERLRRLEREVFWKSSQSQLFPHDLEMPVRNPTPAPLPKPPLYRTLDFVTNKKRFNSDFG